MTETEQVRCLNNGENEGNKRFHEYAIITEGLLRDLEICKEEQMRCRMELDALCCESKRIAEAVRKSFSHSDAEKSMENQYYQESLENLQKRISILEMEKDTVYQMWQMTLKTVEILEGELNTMHKDGGKTKYYEEQLKEVKEMYSEAMKVLEIKLLKAKENFLKNQTLWESGREMNENLSREKIDLERKLSILQGETRSKEETNVRLIESLKSEMKLLRNELERAQDEKLELHEKLHELRSYVTKTIAQNEESKGKVSEALEIAEIAIQEKDMALRRESRTVEEKVRLESRLNAVVEECMTRVDREVTAAKESFERGNKKYILEIKELKVALREKITILDRLERENKLLEEELEKVRSDSKEFFQSSSANVLEMEQNLKEACFKIEMCEETCHKKYEEQIRNYQERITELEKKLATSNDLFRKTQLYGNKELDERIRETDGRTNEALERYSTLERRLARIQGERETIACDMRTLQLNYDREITRRNNERHSQETRIRELENDLRMVSGELGKANVRKACMSQRIESLQQGVQIKQSADLSESEIQTNSELILKVKTLQNKFVQRTRELTQHVETHQKLCQRWKDETKSLATKFQIRSKEFRQKISILYKENEELNKELLICRQQLAHCRLQALNRYDRGDGTS